MRNKYRAWDNENNKYFEPTYKGYMGKVEELVLMQNGDLCIRTINDTYHESTFPDRFIVEMWTGLHDENGEEIYEGDIVSCSEFSAVVVFGKIGYYSRWNGLTGFAFKENIVDDDFYELRYFDDARLLKVIGNIHEKNK